MGEDRKDNESEFFRLIESSPPGDYDQALNRYRALFKEYERILFSTVNRLEPNVVASEEIVEETEERAFRGLHLLLDGPKISDDGGPPPARTDKLRAEHGLLAWLKIIAKDVRRTRYRRMSERIEEDRVGALGADKPGKETRSVPFVFVPIEDEADRIADDATRADWRWERIEEALPVLSERGRLGAFAVLCRSGLPGDLALNRAGVRRRAGLCGILTTELDLRIAAETLPADSARLAQRASLAHRQIARILGISEATSRRLYLCAQAELRVAVARLIAGDEAA